MNVLPAVVIALLVTTLAASVPAAVPGEPAGPAAEASPAKPPKPPKLPKEERRLLAVRQSLGVPDDGEWRALRPHVSRVQALTKRAKDLSDPGKAFEPIKAPKARDGVTASPQPAYLVALSQHAADLRRAHEDPATAAEDIEKRITRYREAPDEAVRQTGAELAAARAAFRELLTARQELAALMAGLLD